MGRMAKRLALLASTSVALIAFAAPAWAAFPGQNGLIAFESQAFDQSDDQEIFVVRPDGTGQTQITNNQVADDADPAVSPCGCTIAFSRDPLGLNRVEGVGNGDIFLIDIVTRRDGTITGTNERQLTGGEAGETNDDFDPSFSPDGTRLVFVRDGDIFVINTDGTGLRQITNNNAFEFVPGFSPDGNTIAFSRFVIDPGETRGDDEIFTVNLATGEERRLTNNDDGDRFTDFSPDGQRIVFESNRTGGPEIFVMNVATLATTQLTDNADDDFIPTFSPDGRRVAFASNRNGGVLNIFTVDSTTGGDARQVSRGVVGAFDPSFGPLAARAPRADLATRVSAPAKVQLGANFAYNITVTNRGPDTATGVVLTTKLPRSVRFVSAPAGCSYNAATRVVRCNLGDIANGASDGTRIVVKAVQAGRVGLMSCAATSTTADATVSNQRASATTTAVAPPPSL